MSSHPLQTLIDEAFERRTEITHGCANPRSLPRQLTISLPTRTPGVCA